MNTNNLSQLGINLASEVPSYQLFGERFNPDGLDSDTIRRISIVSDIIHEFNSETPLVDSEITKSKDAAKIMYPVFKSLNHEECWALLLDSGNHPIKKIKIGEGNVSSCRIDKPRILREMLLCGSSSVIICHNHPGGDPLPSTDDLAQTSSLKDMLKVFEFTLMDHIIFSNHSFYSFADESKSKIR